MSGVRRADDRLPSSGAWSAPRELTKQSEGHHEHWNEIRSVRCPLRRHSSLVPRRRLVETLRFPLGVRLWAAFWLHDIGYFSKRDMDGSDGETHVELGARIVSLLFGKSWGAFTAAHSRYWAKKNGRQFSRLCVADKLAFVMTPAWLYLPMARATGELAEYMLRAKERQAGSEHFTVLESTQLNSQDSREWLRGLKSYTRRWIEEHRDGGADNWTVAAACARAAPGSCQ